MAQVISQAFFPVILNCLIYLIVLYDVKIGGTLQDMLYHRSFIGLSLADMEEIGYIFWAGFYLFFVVLIRHEFSISIGKLVAITFIPTLLVMTVRYLF